MRLNLTISFDPDFIARMDSSRGTVSRGAWLEGQMPGGRPADGEKLVEKAQRIRGSSSVARGLTVQPRPLVQKKR